jgi:hypothetical protein
MSSMRFEIVLTRINSHGSCYCKERATVTHFIGGWLEPRAGPEDMEKGKYFTLPGLELPLTLAVQSVVSLYTDWAIPAPPCYCFFFKFAYGGGVESKLAPLRHVGHLLAYCTCPGWLWGWNIWWNEWQGKPKYSEKTCPSATLSTTNTTWPDPGLIPGRRSGKPATNRFSYGSALRAIVVNDCNGSRYE